VTNGPFRRPSIFPGLLLILLGILFLLARFNPEFRLWHEIWRFSPVLLVLWGVAKLFDTFQASRTHEERPPMLTGGEAALLILVVAVLGGMTVISHIREAHPDMKLDIGMFNEDSSTVQELPAKTIPKGAHVAISTTRGDIHVHGSDDDTEIRVSATKAAHGASESAAKERIDSVDVVIDSANGGYTVHPVNQDDSHGNVRVDLEISVPSSVVLAATTQHGDVQISGVDGAVAATSGQGNVEVHDSGSDVAAQISQGDVRVTNATGTVSVAGKGTEIEITDVKGDANVRGEFYGPIRVRNVAKNTHYSSQKAEIQVTKLTGLLELDAGSIDVSDAGGAVKITTSDKDIDVENVAGKLTIADHNSAVRVGYDDPPKEEINIANSSAAVDLTLPTEATFEINAVSTGGKADSDFEGSMINTTNDGGNGKIMGRVGTGGPKITIATSYGQISLRKGS
jgi:hypothetical protein